MNIDVIFKIAAIGIVITILNQVLIKAGREEQAMLITLVGVVIVLTMVINLITNLFDTVKTMFHLY
ncbi:MAG: stage III sporulation protein AC [Alkaliphilus sp.]|nr:stage III sporulation protein AC [Alkaliphilus sp.]